MPPASTPNLPAYPDAGSQQKLEQVLDLLACPACLQALSIEAAAVVCTGCGRHYPIIDGIPVLLADRAVHGP